MAKVLVFSAFDSQIQLYNPPFFQSHKQQAIRMFEDAVNSPETTVAKHPADFTLYQVAVFDDEKGTFESCVPPVKIKNALELVHQKQDPRGL